MTDRRIYLPDEVSGHMLCVAVGFDPGETTGWCVAAMEPAKLLNNAHDIHNHLAMLDYGQIDCVSQDHAGWAETNGQHAGLNIAGENAGVDEMVEVATFLPKAALVVEDFIPDMRRMDQARHTLSPVRLMAAFSYGMHLSGTKQPLFISDRANPKTTFNNERLTHWGLFDSHGGKHSRDAMRHALYFLRNCVGKSAQSAQRRHLAWPHLFSDPVLDDQRFRSPKPVRVKKLGDRI